MQVVLAGRHVFNFSGFFNPALVFSFQQPGVLYESRSNDGTAVTLRDNTGILETYLQSYPRTGSSNDFQYAYVPSFRCSAPYTYYTCLNANYDSTASWQLVYSDVLNKDYSIDFSNTSLQYSFQTPQLCEWRTGAVDASVSRGVYDGVRSSRVEEIIAALQSASKSYTFYNSSETGWTTYAIAVKGSGTVPCFDCACREAMSVVPAGDNGRCSMQMCNVSGCARSLADTPVPSCAMDKVNLPGMAVGSGGASYQGTTWSWQGVWKSPGSPPNPSGLTAGSSRVHRSHRLLILAACVSAAFTGFDVCESMRSTLCGVIGLAAAASAEPGSRTHRTTR
ncbi:hypothetical protein GUITHDRAFT_108533 [Guillardia theta CCMP2712]|uniref:Uncharacterized protein n=1 Tax=Guillardia theta (strain CCMP2712) TaxID=905079 RepID=L1JAU9_GUITC|nr:hypothetical protein GUITHDRAFT_108533 [Guillardia theta CCMP2712]EKX45656.1 hypothetical protein GUITHDRAFT_108533 [Guillardia theta CCMP2712]|eukprot:XP_005832636.1 hypothetical protein GUITHDRAFT_108533 [Guillardia theta CCMP2712]